MDTLYVKASHFKKGQIIIILHPPPPHHHPIPIHQVSFLAAVLHTWANHILETSADASFFYYSFLG